MQAVTKIRQFAYLIPVLVLAATVLPVALANADGGGKQATVSKSVAQLKKQVRALTAQVAAIQGQANSPRPPGGPAGGDLTGTFPNPLIGPNTVGAAEIQKDAVSAEEIKNDTVGSAEIESNSIDGSDLQAGSVQAEEIAVDAVGVEEIAIGGVGSSEIGNSTVGALELDVVKTAVTPNGTAIGAGQSGSAEVTCPGQTMLIAGGFAWADNEANSIIYSAPSESNPEHTWVVRGFVPSGGNVLYAWATCLQV